ncbi:MAG TPA: DUF305 domain-containing protein [Candidatus Eremiobacteraceae bacterium]
MSHLLKLCGRSVGMSAFAIFVFTAPVLAHPTIDVAASNWKFTPATITVNAGEPTTLRLISTSGTHGIASDDLGISSTMIQPGKFVEVSFTPKTSGTFAVHCSVFCGAGHPNMVLTVVVTGAAAMPTTAPAAATPAPTPMPRASPTAKPTPKPMIDDRHFIIMLVAHDRMGVQLAQLAVKFSKRHDLRVLETTVGAKDTSAIALLGRWYKTWYGSSVPAMAMMTDHAQMPRMDMSPSYLTDAPDFDRAFLAVAIHHSATGAAMSAIAMDGFTHNELRTFARSTASGQLALASQLWRLYDSSYPAK